MDDLELSPEDERGMSAEQWKFVTDWLEASHSPCGRRREELMRSVRPTWQELGKSLAALTGIALAILPNDSDELVEAVGVGLEPSSLAVADHSPGWRNRTADPHPTLNPQNLLVLGAIRAQVAATVDHLQGLASLMTIEAPVRPAFAAARALLISGARAHWLARSDVEQVTRVTRAANLELNEIRDIEADQNTEGEPDNLSELHARRDLLLSAGDDDGLRRNRGKRIFLPTVDGEVDIVADAAPGIGRYAWRTLSSSAHGMDRGVYADFALNKIATLTDDRVRRCYAAGSIFTPVIVAMQGLESASDYLGAKTEILEAARNKIVPIWQRATFSTDGERANRYVVEQIMKRIENPED